MVDVKQYLNADMYCLYVFSDGFPKGNTINKHGINLIYTLIIILASRKPIKLQHVYMPMLFSFCYMVFTAIYFAATQIKVYPILDWSKPEKAVLWVVLYTVLCVPIMHLLLFGVYRLKIYLKERFSETDDKANGVSPPRESDANQNDILGEASTAQLLPVPHEATQNNHIEEV